MPVFAMVDSSSMLPRAPKGTSASCCRTFGFKLDGFKVQEEILHHVMVEGLGV